MDRVLKDLAAVNDSFRGLKSIRRELEEVERFRRELEQALQPPAFLQELERTRRELEQALQPPAFLREVEQFRRQMEQALQPPAFLQELERFRRELEQTQRPLAFLEESVEILRRNTATQQLLKHAWLTFPPAIHLHEFYQDGTITLGNESVSPLEVDEAIQEFFSRIGEPEFFEGFTEIFRKLKGPVKTIVVFIFACLINYIINICSSITYDYIKEDIQPYIDKFLPQSSKEVKTAIKNIPNDIDLRNFTGFRVVTGDRVRLREKPSMKARIIDELNRGKIVKVIEKHRNWTLIEVANDSSDKPLQGWIATRYISLIHR